jgi:crotonobetainyl-CoA:carnitine CoA-transferase CaiB-like acyl-CoA transferase
LRLSKTPPEYRTAPPLLGENTDAVLGELGLSPAEIARLRQTGVI